MKKNLIITFVFIVFCIGKSYSQSAGLGISAGTSNYKGDLDDNLTLKFTRPGFGVHYQKNIFPRISVRLAMYQGWLKADDATGKIAGNKPRNLNFHSSITEGGVHLLIHLFNARKVPRLNIYAFAGVGAFRFNPKTKLNGKTVDLHQLGTEGQNLQGGHPYKLTQFSIPMGGGADIRLSSSLILGLETGLRKTFTDYLDDVSTVYPDQEALSKQDPTAPLVSNRTGQPVTPGKTRGNSAHKDWYIYSNIHVTFYFPPLIMTTLNRNVRFL